MGRTKRSLRTASKVGRARKLKTRKRHAKRNALERRHRSKSIARRQRPRRRTKSR